MLPNTYRITRVEQIAAPLTGRRYIPMLNMRVKDFIRGAPTVSAAVRRRPDPAKPAPSFTA